MLAVACWRVPNRAGQQVAPSVLAVRRMVLVACRCHCLGAPTLSWLRGESPPCNPCTAYLEVNLQHMQRAGLAAVQPFYEFVIFDQGQVSFMGSMQSHPRVGSC